MNEIEFRLITFGCPKVFRKKYISNIHSMFFNNIIRITNGDDLVTKLPPDWLFLSRDEYVHFGQHISIGKFDYRGFLKEHRMPKYVAYVEEFINKEV
jgi:predicted lipase